MKCTQPPPPPIGLTDAVWDELLSMDADVLCPSQIDFEDGPGTKIVEKRCTLCEPHCAPWVQRVVLLPGEEDRVTPGVPTRFTSYMTTSGEFYYYTTTAGCPYFDGEKCSVWDTRPVACRMFPLRAFREQWAGKQETQDAKPTIVTNIRFKVVPVCPAFGNKQRMKFHMLRWGRMIQDIADLLPTSWWGFYQAWPDDAWVSGEKWLQGSVEAPIPVSKAKFPPRPVVNQPDHKLVVSCGDHRCKTCYGKGTLTMTRKGQRVTQICKCAWKRYELRRQHGLLGSKLTSRFGDWAYDPPALSSGPAPQLPEKAKLMDLDAARRHRKKRSRDSKRKKRK